VRGPEYRVAAILCFNDPVRNGKTQLLVKTGLVPDERNFFPRSCLCESSDAMSDNNTYRMDIDSIKTSINWYIYTVDRWGS
jgi:hypothetical protein